MTYCDIHTHIPPAGTDNLAIVNQTVREDRAFTPFPLQSIGIHPWYIYNVREQVGRLEEWISHYGCVAVGEAGFDRAVPVPMALQQEAFLAQAGLSETLQKPLIIHCVKAWQELLDARKQVRPAMPWIVHGFRGKKELAEQLLRQGFYLSFGRYFNAEALQAAWPGRLLTETDDREGAGIQAVYEAIATALAVPAETFALQVRRNVKAVLNI